MDVLIRKTEGEAVDHVIWGEAVPSTPLQIITPSTVGSQTLLNLEVWGSPEGPIMMKFIKLGPNLDLIRTGV